MKQTDIAPPCGIFGYIKEIKGTWRSIRYAFALADSKDARPWLYQKYFFAITAIVLQMIGPKIMATIIDAASNNNRRLATYSITAFFALYVLRHSIEFCRACAHEQLWGRALRNIAEHVSERFFAASPGQHRHSNTLNYESVNKGRNKVIDVYANHMPDLLQSASTIVIAFCFIALTSRFGAMVMGAALLIHLTWSLYLNYRMAVCAVPLERLSGTFERFLAERFRLFERVFVSGKRKEEVRNIVDAWWNVALQDRKLWMTHHRNTIGVEVIIAAALCAMLYHETMIAMEKGFGAITLLYPLFAWSSQIYQDMWQVRDIERHLYSCTPAIEVMRETLEITPDVVDRPHAVPIATARKHPLTLRFNRVSYDYPGTNGTLRNISFEVGPGETVALIGPSGAGKSTVEYLALRFMDPKEGSIEIDDRDVREYQLNTLHCAIGYIPQKPLIFEGTVRENLLYSLNEDEKRAWNDVRLRELMQDLAIDFGVRPQDENPLDIVVGRDGIQLSGGQAQRLAIGIAVIKRPQLLVVDEATSALDSATETRVLKGLRKWINGAGILVIAHRLSTVRDATRTVVLKSGAVEAVGTSFEELQLCSPTFRELIAGQQHLLKDSSLEGSGLQQG